MWNVHVFVKTFVTKSCSKSSSAKNISGPCVILRFQNYGHVFNLRNITRSVIWGPCLCIRVSLLYGWIVVNNLRHMHFILVWNHFHFDKKIHKISPFYIQNLVNIKRSTYSLRHDFTAELPRVNTTKFGLKSFTYEAARVWNSLPNEFRKAELYSEFCRLIQNWSGPICKCSLCHLDNSSVK